MGLQYTSPVSAKRLRVYTLVWCIEPNLDHYYVVLSSLNALYRPDTVQQDDQCNTAYIDIIRKRKDWWPRGGGERAATLLTGQQDSPLPLASGPTPSEDERKHITTTTTTVARGSKRIQGGYTSYVNSHRRRHQRGSLIHLATARRYGRAIICMYFEYCEMESKRCLSRVVYSI